MDITNQDRGKAAFILAVIGDALGWPYEQNSNRIGKKDELSSNEFINWKRRSGGKYYAHIEEIGGGAYSDDSQLLLATARSLMSTETWMNAFSKCELPIWLLYQRGGGGATLRAAKCWNNNEKPWSKKNAREIRYFEAGGNGALMRILPHVIYNSSNKKEMFKQVFANSIYTHGHPRAIIGALIYADAVSYMLSINKTLDYGELIEYLIKNKSQWSEVPDINNIDNWLLSAQDIYRDRYYDIWKQTVEETIDLLKIAQKGLSQGIIEVMDNTLNSLGCFDKKVNGAGTNTAVISIYLACKYASSPQQGLVQAATLKNADTDTIASAVGGLLGALHGMECIPIEWMKVQDFEYVYDVSQRLSEGAKELYKHEQWLQDNVIILKRKMRNMQTGSSFVIAPFNKVELLSKEKLESQISKYDVYLYTCKSEFGQSIYFKDYIPVDKTLETKFTRIEPVKEKNDNRYRTFIELCDSIQQIVPPRITAKKIFKVIELILNELEKDDTVDQLDKMDEIVKKQIIKMEVSEKVIQDLIKEIKKCK